MKYNYLLFENNKEYTYIYNVFNNVKADIKRVYGWNVGNELGLKISNVGIYNDGRINTSMNPLDYAGCYVSSLGFIAIADRKHLKKVIKHYNLDYSVDKFLRWMLCHETCHYIYNNILTDAEKQKYRHVTIDTEYLRTYDIPPDDEIFCEYIAKSLYGNVR